MLKKYFLIQKKKIKILYFFLNIFFVLKSSDKYTIFFFFNSEENFLKKQNFATFFFLIFFTLKSSEPYAKEILPSPLFEGQQRGCLQIVRYEKPKLLKYHAKINLCRKFHSDRTKLRCSKKRGKSLGSRGGFRGQRQGGTPIQNFIIIYYC